jgi:hypothetical protein
LILLGAGWEDWTPDLRFTKPVLVFLTKSGLSFGYNILDIDGQLGTPLLMFLFLILFRTSPDASPRRSDRPDTSRSSWHWCGQAVAASIDGTATFEPIDGVDMAQIMEPERSEMLILFLGLDRHGLNDAAKVGWYLAVGPGRRVPQAPFALRGAMPEQRSGLQRGGQGREQRQPKILPVILQIDDTGSVCRQLLAAHARDQNGDAGPYPAHPTGHRSLAPSLHFAFPFVLLTSPRSRPICLSLSAEVLNVIGKLHSFGFSDGLADSSISVIRWLAAM